MPAKSDWEKQLLTRFISVYDCDAWADSLLDWVDEHRNGGIDLLATRKSDGASIAIEHTVIQPSPLEKADFARFDRVFSRSRMADGLSVPGLIVYVNVPAGTLVTGQPPKPIADAVFMWIAASIHTFSDELRLRDCPVPGGRTIQLQTQAIPTDGDGVTIVRRYGEFDVDATVMRALERKLPKLVATDATKRILMLERDQPPLHPAMITKALERCRSTHPMLAQVDQVWIAETHDAGRIVLFDLARSDHRYAPVYTFAGERLQWRTDR